MATARSLTKAVQYSCRTIFSIKLINFARLTPGRHPSAPKIGTRLCEEPNPALFAVPIPGLIRVLAELALSFLGTGASKGLGFDFRDTQRMLR